MGNLAELKVVVGSDIDTLRSGLRNGAGEVVNFDRKISSIGDNTAFTTAGSKVSGFGSNVDDVGNKTTGFGSKLGKVGEIAGGFLAANVIGQGFAALGGFLSESIAASSNLGESINAVSKIFGTSQQKILDWGKNNAVSFGLSQRAFNELATPLGAGLKNAGLDMDTVADLTIKLTERAADMASVFNTDVGTAMEALQSAFRGEMDPIEKFGVGLSAAKVQAQAMADTGKTVASSLTTQELTMARYKLIMDQTNTSAGDFRATSDGYANSQRIAAAKTEELQAKIGDKLVPVMLKLNEVKLALVTVIAEKLLPVLGPLIDFAARNPVLLAVLAGVIGGVLVIAFTAWAVSATAAAFATLGLTWPIALVVAAIAGIVVAVIWVVQHWDWLAERTQAIWDGIWRFIGGAWDLIKGIVSGALQFVTGLFLSWTPVGIIVKHWNDITGVFRVAGEYIGNIVRWMVDNVSGVLSWFGNLPGMFWGWMNGIGEAIRSAINYYVDLFFSLPQRILNVLKGFDAWNAGVALVSSFWNGIVSRWNQMIDWVRAGMGYLRDLWPFSPARTGPFSGRGYVTYSGAALTSDFADSIMAGIPLVVSAATRLAGAVSAPLAVVDSAGTQPLSVTLAPPAGIAASARTQPLRLVFSGADPGSELGRAILEYLRESLRVEGRQGVLG